MPSDPRPKDQAAAPKKDQVLDAETLAKHGLPEGSSVGEKPAEGIWYRALDAEGQPIVVDGSQVRVP